jgi:hypothetical protein
MGDVGAETTCQNWAQRGIKPASELPEFTMGLLVELVSPAGFEPAFSA